MANQQSPCFLTVDVEDYFHVEAFARIISPQQWESYDPRVEKNTHRILELFDHHSVRGTFFILGWVAMRFPQLVAEIHRRGHEVACHSYWHRLVYALSPTEFHEDTRRAKEALEDIISHPVCGYRAPSFSITRKSLWALEILAELGFRYDASIYPIHHDTYGIPDWDSRAQVLETRAGSLVEIPGSTVRWGNHNLGCGGGGYLRILPVYYNVRAIRSAVEKPGHHGMVYFHPWEVDPDQPRIGGIPLRSRLRHYTGLSRFERRLTSLLEEFQMSRITDCMPSLLNAERFSLC